MPRSTALQPPRRQGWVTVNPQEVLARYRPHRTDPLLVLEVLIELFNTQHTALGKSVSYKTREQRAKFLRRFFRDLKTLGGFSPVPDPRNLGERHVAKMVQIWQQKHLHIGTVQTYLSFLRGLCAWVNKPGMVRHPQDYGFHCAPRQEVTDRDKSWSGQGVDIAAKIEAVTQMDERVGTTLRLMLAFGLRAKEAIMFRPHRSVMVFEETGLPTSAKVAARYVRIKEGSKGGRLRFVPVLTAEQESVLTHAQALAASADLSIGDPAESLASNLRRFYYVLGRQGITRKAMGTTSHGLRHEVFIDAYEAFTGVEPPVRGGQRPDPRIDRAARLAVSRIAGHARPKAASAYLGRVQRKRKT